MNHQTRSKYDLLDFISREPSVEEAFLAQYGPELQVAGSKP